MTKASLNNLGNSVQTTGPIIDIVRSPYRLRLAKSSDLATSVGLDMCVMTSDQFLLLCTRFLRFSTSESAVSDFFLLYALLSIAKITYFFKLWDISSLLCVFLIIILAMNVFNLFLAFLY